MTAVEMEREIVDLRERVGRLEQRTEGEGGNGRVPEPWEAHLPPYLRLVDGRTLKAVFERALRKAGYDPKPPSVTAEELQARMIREGVRPEDRIASTILAEMRGDSE